MSIWKYLQVYVTRKYYPVVLHSFSKRLELSHFIAAAAKSLQSCPTVWPHRRQSTRLPYPWDSPGKSTGVGCYFLLQCMKVKSESEVSQSCPTLSDPMDCSLPGSSIHEIFQARVLEWGAIAFSGIYPAAAAAKSLQSCPTLCNPRDSSPPGSPIPGILQARVLEWVAISFSNAWKWKVKVKSLNRVRPSVTPWTAAF